MKKSLKNLLICSQLLNLTFSFLLIAESESKEEEDKYWNNRRLQIEQEQKIYDNERENKEIEQKRINDQIERRRLERQREDRNRNRNL